MDKSIYYKNNNKNASAGVKTAAIIYIIEQIHYLVELSRVPQFVVSDAKVTRIQSLASANWILTAVMSHSGQISLAALSEHRGLNKTTVGHL